MERKLRWRANETIGGAWSCVQEGKKDYVHRAWISQLSDKYVGMFWQSSDHQQQHDNGYWAEALTYPRGHDVAQDKKVLRKMQRALKVMLYLGMDTGL